MHFVPKDFSYFHLNGNPVMMIRCNKGTVALTTTYVRSSKYFFVVVPSCYEEMMQLANSAGFSLEPLDNNYSRVTRVLHAV